MSLEMFQATYWEVTALGWGRRILWHSGCHWSNWPCEGGLCPQHPLQSKAQAGACARHRTIPIAFDQHLVLPPLICLLHSKATGLKQHPGPC